MSVLKATPGPWRLARNPRFLAVVSDASEWTVCSFPWGLDDEQHETNAKLIAASPTMFEALDDALDTVERLLDDLREEDDQRHAQRIAVLDLTATNLRAALAEARGKVA